MPEPVFGPDVLKIREQIYSFIKFDDALSIIDIGSGYGYDLTRFGMRCGVNAKLTGIDSALKPVEIAREKTKNDSRFTFIHKDISNGLPFDDESFDIVYSNNLLECIKDKEAFLSEVYRILKPGGQVIFCHIDWDTQVINGNDKQLRDCNLITRSFSWSDGVIPLPMKVIGMDA